MRRRRSVFERVREAFEDRIYRPVFFAVVLPPILVWDWWQHRKGKRKR